MAAAVASALALGLSMTAMADELADACLDYTRSSAMLKEAPAANKSKWCGCIADKIAPADRNSVAAVIKLQKNTEAKGEAFGENIVPPAQAKAFNQYFAALGPCLPVMMGTGPGGPGAPPASAPRASAPPASAHNANFSLVNATGYPIGELYVSSSKSKTWGKDLLGDHTIENDDTWKITFPQSKSQCLQDMKIVFADDDSEAVWEGFDLCRISKMTLTYNRKTGVTTAKTE
jgi:hypothetical protein